MRRTGEKWRVGQGRYRIIEGVGEGCGRGVWGLWTEAFGRGGKGWLPKDAGAARTVERVRQQQRSVQRQLGRACADAQVRAAEAGAIATAVAAA
eukprot:6173781-Pleurochrysis_carterae.AAC.2